VFPRSWWRELDTPPVDQNFSLATAPFLGGYRMDNFKATMIAEGVDSPETDEEHTAAWQHLIDTGLAWQLQGWFGRRAKLLIDDGTCIARDASGGAI